MVSQGIIDHRYDHVDKISRNCEEIFASRLGRVWMCCPIGRTELLCCRIGIQVGTKINHRQNPDITECTCLTKPWRQRFFQCFTRTDIPPDCPVHSSEGSTVGKEANSNEKQRTSRPGRVRRFGRWIAKRVTKGKREEPEEATLAISATDNCVAPESTDITTADEFSPAPESHMLLPYVRTAAAGYTGSKATGINETNEDTTDSVAQTKEKKTELDINSMKPKSKQTTVMSLKELCKAVVAYSDGLNLYTYNLELDDTEALEYHEINEPEQDSTSLTSELNDSVLMTLVQLSTNVIDNNQDTATDVAHPKATIEPDNTSLYSELDKSVLTILVQLSTSIDSSQDVAQPKTAIKPDNTRLRSEFDKSVLTILVQLSTSIDSSQDVAQPIATNTELDTYNEKYEEMYQNTIMSLKEMCEAVLAYSDDMKPNTDNSKSEDTEGLDNHDTNKPEQDNTNLTTDEKRVAVEQILSAKSLLCLAEKKFNEDGFQREMYFHTNRDAKTDSSLTQSHIYTISDKVHQESTCIRRRQIKKSKKVWSHGREKASRGKYNIAELLGLVCNPMLTSKNIENNNIILAAKKKQSDDFIYTSQTTKKPTRNQTAYDVQRISDTHNETVRGCRGAEGGIHPGSVNDLMKEAEFSLESHVEHYTGKKNDIAKGTEISSEFHMERNLGIENAPMKEAELF